MMLTGQHATALPQTRSEILVLLWTIGICLDEWYKWVVLPSTFHVHGWRLYNYAYLSITLLGFGLRACFSADLGHAVLSFNCVVGWVCRSGARIAEWQIRAQICSSRASGPHWDRSGYCRT